MQSTKHAYMAYQEAQAHDLDQAKLILMMFAGAIRFINKGLEAASGEQAESDRYFARAKNVILELISSLNIDTGGEMGTILLRAYRGLFLKLTAAQLQKDMKAAAEVRDSLAELEDSWKKVFSGPDYQLFRKDPERYRALYAGR
jgi:flagellar secretion chaperone FliS